MVNKKEKGKSNPKKSVYLVFAVVAILLFVATLGYLLAIKYETEETNIASDSKNISGCKVLISGSPTPTPYDPSNPYSHVVVLEGIYIDYIQGYCFIYPKDKFTSNGGSFTSPKSLIEKRGEIVYNFNKPHLTIDSSVSMIDKYNSDNNMSKIEDIRLPIGAVTKRENLTKIDEKITGEFERATFYYKTKNSEYFDSVGYKTLWYLPAKNKVAEFKIFAHIDYESDLEAFKPTYNEIIESFEFF